MRPLSTSLPRWQGEPVDYAASGIVLHAEQGFGDSLQFARFVPMAAILAIAGSLAAKKRIAVTEGRIKSNAGMMPP